MDAPRHPTYRIKPVRREGRAPPERSKRFLALPRPVVELAEAAVAIRLARRAIASRFDPDAPRDVTAAFRNEPMPEVLDERRGVFVTLHTAASGRLRGCIGYPLPVFPLRVAIPRVAVSAAFDDPRFPSLARGELAAVALELSILTVPEPIGTADPDTRVGLTRVGQDGLIIEVAGESGLLLPQVAVEERWDSREFLEATCEKAGLPPGTWRRKEAQVYRFQAEVFREIRPEGPVEREPLTVPSAGPGRRG
jgi:uncharacterized protein (TIGR00296 family)